MKIKEVSPIRIVYSDPFQMGVSVQNGFEQIPTTDYALKKLNIKAPEDFLKPTYLPLDRHEYRRLRDYQFDDVRLLANRAVGIIASHPRTGKTPTAISIFRAKGVEKMVIVVPQSIILQWREEIKLWGVPDMAVYPYLGSPKQRVAILKEWGNTKGVLITSFETLRIDHLLILKHKDIDGIIIDEGHRAKNHKSQVYQALKKFHKVKHKLWMSGTLSPNKPEEVFTSLSFLIPDLFRGYYKFLEYYFQTETIKNWATKREYLEIGGIKNNQELPQFIKRIAVQRTQEEVMPWLEGTKGEPIEIKLEPTLEQSRYIEQMLSDFEIEGTEVIAQGVLDQLLRIRQIANDPELLELKGKSPKTEWIKQYIKDYPDEQILIFSNFSSYLKILHKQLPGTGLIIGETKSEQRDYLKKSFQAGNIKVLLINIKAGKEGLTLDNGDTVIFTDVFPPAADVVQAENRITATTPDKVKISNIIRLMLKDTYDEQLYGLVDRNTTLTSVINDFKKHLGKE